MSERQKGMIALGIVLASWSLSSVFVKYLIQQGYDPHTQNFYRYAAGTIVVIPFLWRRVRQRGIRLQPAMLALLLIPTLPNISHQIAWTMSLNWIHPGLASFLNKSSVLFAAVLAFALYAEERWLFRSRRFLIGLFLTLGGTVGLALWRGDLHNLQVNLGVGLGLVAAFSWAAYSVAAKRPTTSLGSTVAFGVVGIYSTAILFFVARRWGNLAHWWVAPWYVNVIMLVSGALCIGVAHTLYYYAMRALTVSVCATMLLTTPLGTLWISRWLFGEQMSAGQIVSGLVLIVGGIMTLLAREERVVPVVARAAESADA